jgi:glutaredoxin-like YruB-family protein
MCRIAAFLVALLCIAAPAAAQVYKWTDPSGKTHYGDKPPADAATKELDIRVPSYEGPVEVADWGAVLRRKPPAAAAPRASSGVTMYATDWCPHCRNARQYFAAKGIAFTEVNVETSPAGREEYRALGGKGVPLIVVGDKVMRGFSPQRFEALRK